MPGVERLPGHPPRTTRPASFSASILGAIACGLLPANSARMDTSPDDVPDSSSVIGLMCSRSMRPMPLCAGLCSRGVEEPVRTKVRSLPLASIAARTMSHSCGTSCHSSMRCGEAPRKASSGAASIMSRLGVAPSELMATNAEFANAYPVHVLPQYFGPLIFTPPKSSSAKATWRSRMRGM